MILGTSLLTLRKPIVLKSKVLPASTFSWYLPSTSVITPFAEAVPLTTTDTPIKGVPSASLTTPLTNLSCACATPESHSKQNINHRTLFFIILAFLSTRYKCTKIFRINKKKKNFFDDPKVFLKGRYMQPKRKSIGEKISHRSGKAGRIGRVMKAGKNGKSFFCLF